MSRKTIREQLEKLRDDNPIPTALMDEELIGKVDFDYSTRGPGDYVVSGPITGKSTGPGREFNLSDDAEEWGRAHFGDRFKYRIFDAEKGGRWAILVAPKDTM